MIVRQSLADVPAGERSVALGSFDAVHLGHRAVIGAAVATANERGLRSAVLTFHPPPIAVLRPEVKLVQLSSLSRRAALVAELEADELVIVRFDREFAQLEADEFASRVLAQTLGARHVSVGENFHYGRGAKGNPAKLAEEGLRLGFDVHAEPLLELGGAPISSSRVRALVAAGAVEEAAALLGRPPWLEGAVRRGDGRGRAVRALADHRKTRRQGLDAVAVTHPDRDLLAGGETVKKLTWLSDSQHGPSVLTMVRRDDLAPQQQ